MSVVTAVRIAPVVAVSLLVAACAQGSLDGMGSAGATGGGPDGSQAMLAMAQSHGEIVPAAARLPIASLLPRTGWTATASDAGTAPAEPARNVLDGNRRTMWHSRWTRHDPPFPHTITLDLHQRTQVSGLVALPRQDGNRRGRIGRYAVTVSADGRSWSTVATGTWADTAAAKTVTFATVAVRFVRLTARSEAGGTGTASELVELDLLGPSTTTPVSGRPLPRAGWRATASDAQSGSPGHPASAVLDGNPTTVWSSRYAPAAALPHSLTIDMGRATTVRGLTYLPRQDGLAGGRIGAFRVSVSADGRVFGPAVAGGSWADDARAKAVGFRQIRTRFVRLTALTEAGRRGPWSTAAEIDLLGTPTAGSAGPAPTPKPAPKPAPSSSPQPTAKPTSTPKPTSTATASPPASPTDPAPVMDPAPVIDNTGSWGPVIGFPIVPVSAVLLPGDRLLTFSAYGPNTFSTGGHEQTQTAVLDLASGTVSQRQVIETGQEMFCSGIAVLPDGRVLVNGAATAGRRASTPR